MKLKLPNAKKMFAVICVFTLSWNITKAQFTDFKPYPETVTPHESKDSTRGHVWGYMFGSYYTKLHADSGQLGNTQYSRLPQGANAFSIQRLYLGYDYFLNKKFSGHVVISHEENADDAYSQKISVDPGNNRSFFLKYAYAEWDNIFKGSTITLGAIPTPGFAVTEEPFWGYRSIDRTIMDMKGIAPSNDVGVNLGGKIWSKKDGSGMESSCIGYNFMIGNSTSTVPDNFGITSAYTIWKRYYGDLYVKLLNDKLVLDIYGDQHTLQLSPFHASLVTARVFLGYKTKRFNIGVEYFQQTQQNLVSEISTPDKPQGDTINNIQSGYSVLAAAVLMKDKKTGDPKLSIYARYDFFNPDVKYNADAVFQTMTVNSDPFDAYNPITETYFVAGLDYQPIKQIHIMPNIWYDGIANRANNLTPLEKNDYDLVARITFYYQFFKN